MRAAYRDLTIIALQFVLGIVVLERSFVFVFGHQSAEHFGRNGLPGFVRLALGWSEIAAAVLFLLPPTLAVGGWSLILVFAAAAGLHLAHGEFDIGGLAVLAAGVMAVLAHRRPAPPAVAAAGR